MKSRRQLMHEIAGFRMFPLAMVSQNRYHNHRLAADAAGYNERKDESMEVNRVLLLRSDLFSFDPGYSVGVVCAVQGDFGV